MNPTAYSTESLKTLSRTELVRLAKNLGVKSEEGKTIPHSKSAFLIEAIAKLDPATEAAAEVVTDVAPSEPVIEATAIPEEPAVTLSDDNVVQVKFGETKTPEAPKTSSSNGLFKVSRKIFQRQLAAVGRIVDNAASMTLLRCVLIGFRNGHVTVEGTNLDAYVSTDVHGETDGEFEIAIRLSLLAKFVSKCSSEFLMAEVSGCVLRISDAENKTEIHGIPAGEWITRPTPLEKEVLTISAKRFAQVIADTLPCVSTDETRYIINGVLLDTTADTPVMVATDGRRLVRADLGAELVQTEDKFIIPSKTAQALRFGMPLDGNATVFTRSGVNRLCVKAESTGMAYQASFKCVEGNYPKYSEVIPKDLAKRPAFKVLKEDLNSTLGRILVVSEEGNRGSSIKLVLNGTGISIAAANADVGQGNELVPAVGPAGKEIQIAMSGVYIRDTIAPWSDEKLTLTVVDQNSPMVICGNERFAVIMPVRMS